MQLSLLRKLLAAGSLAVSFGCLVGCGGTPAGGIPVNTAGSSADVYVAGFDMSPDGKLIAAAWKNGVALPMTNTAYGGYINSVAVSDSDVYAAGIQGNGAQDVAGYWKNGQFVALTDGTQRGFANSIFVANGDVYVAGAEQPSITGGVVAKYWKNGVPVLLTDGSSNAFANSILISGPDVYVAGYQYKTTQTGPNSWLTLPVAVYWKNGVAVPLTDGSGFAIAQSIDVVGQDVYVAGAECLGFDMTKPDCELATYWKNGAATNLTTAVDTLANSVSISGADIYVAGDQFTSRLNYDVAEYWKNGNVTLLSDGTTSTGTNQLVVSGGHVYVAGYSISGAAYWIDGQRYGVMALSSESTAFAIAVVSH